MDAAQHIGHRVWARFASCRVASAVSREQCEEEGVSRLVESICRSHADRSKRRLQVHAGGSLLMKNRIRRRSPARWWLPSALWAHLVQSVMLFAAALVVSLALNPTALHTPSSIRAHRGGSIFASEANSDAPAPDGIFTLEERKDGWDDVRGSIKGAIKDRQGAVKALNAWNTQYVAPAARWAKVLAEELPLPSVEMPSVDLPSVDLPSKLTAAPSSPAPSSPASSSPAPTSPALTAKASPPKSLKDRVLGVTTAVLDRAAKQKQEEVQVVVPTEPVKEVTAGAKTIAAANIALLVGVPIGTLALLWTLAVSS